MFLLYYTSVAPVISPKVMDQTLNEGSNAVFICNVTGEPVPAISWYFNGPPLDEANSDKYTITPREAMNNAYVGMLNIKEINSSDVGTYTCNATNVVSTDTSSGVLTVNGELLL